MKEVRSIGVWSLDIWMGIWELLYQRDGQAGCMSCQAWDSERLRCGVHLKEGGNATGYVWRNMWIG